MSRALSARMARNRRHRRVRKTVRGTKERPRLSVFRSLKHISAQIIDDDEGHTLVAASTLDAEIRRQPKGRNKTEQAELVGQLLAQRALERGVKQVVFDRGGNKYHGRVRSLAEVVRAGGLEF